MNINFDELDEPIRIMIEECTEGLDVSPTVIVNQFLTRILSEKTAYDMETGETWEEGALELCRKPDGSLFSGEALFEQLVFDRIFELRDMGLKSKKQYSMEAVRVDMVERNKAAVVEWKKENAALELEISEDEKKLSSYKNPTKGFIEQATRHINRKKKTVEVNRKNIEAMERMLQEKADRENLGGSNPIGE